MKIVVNKTTTIKYRDNLLSRVELLKLVVNHATERGITISDMRTRMRILDVLEGSGDNINIEDADFTLMKKLFDQYGWLQLHKDIIELADHLDELDKTK